MALELRRLEDVLKAEGALLAALCQQVLTASQRAETMRALAAYRWRDQEHQVIFEVLRELGPASAPQLREELPRQLTRKGFPDTGLEPLLRLQGLSATQALELARALLARRNLDGSDLNGSHSPPVHSAGEPVPARSPIESVSPRALRPLALLDVVAVPLLVEWFIWRLQFRAPKSWVIFPIWLTASFLLHRDTPETLGWRADNLWPATKQAAIVFAVFVAALVAMCFAFGGPRQLPLHLASLKGLWNYFAFCLLQQVVSESFVANRLLSLISRRWLAALVVGAIFAIAHWPNPVLVPLTFVGGTVLAWLFARHRNIIPLAIGQALVGMLVWWSFPVAWHHGLRVGPGYRHYPFP
jgi:hypothetical protein